MHSSIVEKIVEQTVSLPDELQRRVLEYAKSLSSAAPEGVPGERLIRFADAIPPDDLERMREAIEQGCERVDSHEW